MSKKMLVAYFSASGVTAKAAWKLSEAAGADLYEIKPEIPYSREDLDWMDKKSRSSVEMNDPASRPVIAGKMEDMDQYEVVFVGFPIWWYIAPKIINTFLESYDFSGKTIVTFATSGGSGMGSTNEKLAPSCSGAILLEGKMLNGVVTQAELKAWAENTADTSGVDANTSVSVQAPGNVARMAAWIQQETGGDLFSIRVEEPYSADYDECLDRAADEKAENARSVLVEKVLDMAG